MSKSKLRVLHPMNSAGTTWLRESDLVFVGKRPFAVVMPDVWIPLNRKMLSEIAVHSPAVFDELADLARGAAAKAA